MSLIKAEAIERGLCCNSCQEPVNMHKCEKCGKEFNDRDVIYCEDDSSIYDAKHYHEECKPKERR